MLRNRIHAQGIFCSVFLFRTGSSDGYLYLTASEKNGFQEWVGMHGGGRDDNRKELEPTIVKEETMSFTVSASRTSWRVDEHALEGRSVV